MKVENLSTHRSHKRGDNKPGLALLKGRNYDSSRVAIPSVFSLVQSMFMTPGVKNNRPNNYTIKHASDRNRFYREARENKVIYSGEKALNMAIRLGGTNE